MAEFMYGTYDEVEDAWCGKPVCAQLLELAAMSQEGIKLPDDVPEDMLKAHQAWLALPHNRRIANKPWVFHNIHEWEAVNIDKRPWSDYFWRYL